jgi:2-oxoglutarate dehydrogenase E1 component
LFSEFEGKAESANQAASGDVKYHQGFSSDINTEGGAVHLALAFNPSHLEIVSPVAVGSVKARQQRRADSEFAEVLPISVHGDAAFAGQGVVMETFNMAECRGYRTGGTIHVVLNNQVGFTTSNPQDARSTPYCTDVAKMVDTPIFHVNGDDPEAVVFVTRLALDYRMAFNKDVVIDLVCYRRHGHNEADEPSITQPIMYQVIRELETTRSLYAKKLLDEGTLSESENQALIEDYRSSLDSGDIVVEDFLQDQQGDHMIDWSPFLDTNWYDAVDTRLDPDVLGEIAEASLNIPDDFELHPRTSKILEDRHLMSNGEKDLDWGMAESLAYATLLKDGFNVRLSGQDSGRGTFSHRHAVLHNMSNQEVHIPLQNLFENQPGFRVIDSLLSEEAVLAFEYGYATADPHTLVIWEAQFGDFANGAQVVIDQFISSGEAKWGRLCGLTMFLPHGYEGQGPEHSSARLERFLQLCAGYNIQVCAPTTPGQMYHLLRRQMVRPFRKPLVVMTPKSLLRHKLSVSTMDDLANGKFCNTIPEIDEIEPGKVGRVVLCSGKVYYDLLQERRKRACEDVAIARVEQLYPFPRDEVTELLRGYENLKEVVWCQEEPLNQGAWYQIKHHLTACISADIKLVYAGREASASPACGYYSTHQAQQDRLVSEALSPLTKSEEYTPEKRHVS